MDVASNSAASRLSRREVIAGAVATAAAVGFARAGRADAAPGSPFRHGVASGDPLADGVILWTRVTPRDPGEAAGVGWVIARDPELRQVVASGRTVAAPDADWTVKVDPRGLEPATPYWYAFTAYGSTSPVGRTRTAPSGHVDRLRLAVVSCSSYAAGFFNAYARIADRDDLDAVVHLGDYIYETDWISTRTHQPGHEVVSLADYRTRYAQYRSDPDLQRAHHQHPWVVVWDDHEVANDAWRDGADNHQAREGSWEDRKRAAARAYAEWMPIRLPDPTDAALIHRRLSFGDLVDLVMLDTRLQRRQPGTPTGTFDQASDDPARSMLGPAQKAWLFEELRASAARGTAWRLIGNQAILSPVRDDPSQPPLPYLPEEVIEAIGVRQGGGASGAGNWGAYQVERDEVIAVLRETGDAVVLTGDAHSAWGFDVVEDPYNTLRYEPVTGRGAAAVELVCTSVTSHNLEESQPESAPALNAAVLAGNPNVQHVDLAGHGYLLADVTPERVTAQWWKTGTVRARGNTHVLSAELLCRRGTAHLVSALRPPR